MMGLCILGQSFYMNFMQADMWLGNLLLERSDDIYRMKGILSVSGMPQRFVFQVLVTLAYKCIQFNFMSCSAIFTCEYK
jgi:G3E family GTPase